MAPIANLTIRISAQIAELQKSFADANKATKNFQDNFAGMATAAATVGTFLGNVFTKIASSIASTLGKAVGDAVKYAQQFQNAFLGLGSVAAANGISMNAATAAAKALAADGLIPVGDAAKGLKNLLAKGFNLEQSTRLMNAFKDSAAFGRQSALSMGEAVSSAAEGVKNHNNQLVDNAGVTKNLSQILKAYGYQLEDLDDKTKGAGARQALYNGILKETAAQAGDAARASGTYTGAMSALETSYVSLLATWGEAITKNKSVQTALVAVADGLRSVTDWLGKNDRAFNFVSDAVIFLVETLASLIRGFDNLQTGLAEMDKALSGTVRIAIVGIQKITDLLIDLLKIAVKVPGVAKAIGFAGLGDEVAGLIVLNTKARTTQEAMNAEMQVTQTRSRDMSKTLQGLATKIDGVAAKVKAAKGQLVELGETTKPNNLEQGGLEKLSKEAIKAQKVFAKVLADIHEFEAGVGIQDFSDMFDWNKAVQNAKIMRKQITDELSLIDIEKKVPVVEIDKMFDWDKAVQNAKIMKAEITAELTSLETAIKPDLQAWFADLPNVIRGAMANGGSIFEAVGRSAGASFSAAFAKHLKAATDAGRALTGGEKGLGVAAIGLEGFFGGFDIGRSGGKTKGALGGAASGALSGAMAGSVIPGIGTVVGGAIGGIAGLFGGLFGGSKKAKEDRKQLEANKAALLEQYGGMQKLQALAQSLGVDISKAFNAKTPEAFTAAVEELNKAIDDQKKRIEGLNTALKGVNDRAAIFADKFSALYAAANKPPAGDKLTDKEAQARKNATAALQAQAQASEGEFARLGLMIRDTFAGLVKETGNGISALQQMAPAFQMLEDGVSQWGLTSTAVIDELRANFNLVNDETFKPLFAQIASSGEVLRGLFDAKALSPEGFQAIAADIGLSIQGIIDKGGDAAKTLALSQPVLQTLWEAQQQYGAVTDETTAAILKQAEEQGLVGGHMKDVNQQILDVLLAIGDVLGATLPDYFNKLKQPAADAATAIEDSFNGIKIDPLRIQVEYDAGKPPAGISVPALAAGGIVRRPTLALIGESGPEAVVPLTGQALDVAGSYETSIYLDGEKIARSSARRIPRIMREMGVGH